jgi:8-oxo-dGTP diphosphatase
MYKIKNNHLQVVCGIIEENDRILVAKRSSIQVHAGFWEFPGGKIHTDEAADAAIIRELQEELNITVLPYFQLPAVCHNYSGRRIELLPFVCYSISGNLHPLEHEAICWIDPNTDPDYELLPPDREVLALYRSYRSAVHLS